MKSIIDFSQVLGYNLLIIYTQKSFKKEFFLLHVLSLQRLFVAPPQRSISAKEQRKTFVSQGGRWRQQQRAFSGVSDIPAILIYTYVPFSYFPLTYNCMYMLQFLHHSLYFSILPPQTQCVGRTKFAIFILSRNAFAKSLNASCLVELTPFDNTCIVKHLVSFMK